MSCTSGSQAAPWVWWCSSPGRQAALTSEVTPWGWSPTRRSPRPPWLSRSCCSASDGKGSRHPFCRQGNPPSHPAAPGVAQEGTVAAIVDFLANWRQYNISILSLSVVADLLANSCLFSHPADTKQRKHFFGVVFVADWESVNPIITPLLVAARSINTP